MGGIDKVLERALIAYEKGNEHLKNHDVTKAKEEWQYSAELATYLTFKEMRRGGQ
jgi:hypothetical protein